ncbi:MAG: M48 family metallopeptidase [Candidatus Brocadiaceae bacterium]|nr:M48 family metallopeptidase [Candidatus Brocadiaceae bacterium]
MNITSTRLEGSYYDGKVPIAHPALLVLGDNEVTLTSGDTTLTYELNKLRVTPRTGHADRFITLSDGGQYQCTDQPILDRLPQEIRSEGLVAWFENRISIVVASAAIIICALLIGYFFGLPVVGENIAKQISIETAASLGDHVLAWFDNNKWFNTSHIKQDQQDSITNKFNKLHEGLSMSPHIKLEFRCSERIGPNAFALPGGTIVITDQMIEIADSKEEILAILAHEIGHAELRHCIREIVQGSVVALVATTITADAASLSAAVTGLPVIMAQTKYSRDFERESDEFAFHLLTRNHISTEAFASIMERLDKDNKSIDKLSFVSTHPVTYKRIERAREFNNTESD